MKYYFILLFSICSSMAFSQSMPTRSQLQPINATGYEWQTGSFKKGLYFPQDTLHSADSGAVAIKNSVLYIKNINQGINTYWGPLTGGGIAGTIQEVLTAGDTSLRKIIYKDTSSSSQTTGMVFATVVPSNYGTVYPGHGKAMYFNSSFQKFHDVNADGRPNVVGNFWSYNTDPGGGVIDTAEGGFRFGTETHYQLGAGNDDAFEFHLPEISPRHNGTKFRPFSMYILEESGLTNTNMQIHQLSLKKQLDANIDWLVATNNEGNAEFNLISDDDAKQSSLSFKLPSSIISQVYNSNGFSISSNKPTDVFGTNMPISYGSALAPTGMDGYGNHIMRQGALTITNTGVNTSFAAFSYNGVEGFNFNSTNGIFSLPTLHLSRIVMIGNIPIQATAGYPLILQSSDGSGGDINFIDGQGGARTMTLFKPNDGAGNSNLNIGAGTTNPGKKLNVQGDISLDSTLYLGRLSADPSVDLQNGSMYYNTSTNKFRGYQNSAWVDMIGASGITSINTETGASQTLSAGPGVSVVSSSDVHTISLTTNVDAQYTDANNTGTSVTDLYTATLAASKMGFNGQTLHFEAAGVNNDATATVNLEVTFAGNSIAGAGAVTISSTGPWSIKGMIIRSGTTTARAYTVITIDGSTQKVFSSTANITGLNFAVSNDLKLRATAGGAGGGSNDITAQMWKVIFQP